MNSTKRTSRIAGLLNLIIAVCAPFSVMYVPSKLIVLNDASATANNIMASETLFRIASVNGLTVHVLQIFVAFLLYRLLKSVNKNGALLMLILSLVGVSIAMMNEINQFASLILLSGADYLKAFSLEQLHAQAMFFINMHSYGLIIAQIFWGLWLLPLGYLVFKSKDIPKIIAILLIVAGLGYLIDCLGKLLSPNYNITVSMFTFIGELLFTFWLLIKGVNEPQ